MMKTEKFMKHLETSMNILIILNAIAFGLLTDESVKSIHSTLNIFCDVSLIIFIIELIIRISVYKKSFFVGPNKWWNYFDSIIVLLSCMASIPVFASMRIFRIFRIFRQLNILRIIPSSKKLKIIIEAITHSFPGICWTVVLYMIVIYTYALIGTEFFGSQFSEWFGSAWRSMYTLFQVMTLESWSMGIARPVMSVYPAAWVYFVSYVIISSFVILNIVVALVLNSLNEVSERNKKEDNKKEDNNIAESIKIIEKELERIKELSNSNVK